MGTLFMVKNIKKIFQINLKYKYNSLRRKMDPRAKRKKNSSSHRRRGKSSAHACLKRPQTHMMFYKPIKNKRQPVTKDRAKTKIISKAAKNSATPYVNGTFEIEKIAGHKHKKHKSRLPCTSPILQRRTSFNAPPRHHHKDECCRRHEAHLTPLHSHLSSLVARAAAPSATPLPAPCARVGLKSPQQQLLSHLQEQYERLWQRPPSANGSGTSREGSADTVGVMLPTSIPYFPLGFSPNAPLQNELSWLQQNQQLWASAVGGGVPICSGREDEDSPKYHRPHSASQVERPESSQQPLVVNDASTGPYVPLDHWGQRQTVPSQEDNYFATTTQSCHHLQCSQEPQSFQQNQHPSTNASESTDTATGHSGLGKGTNPWEGRSWWPGGLEGWRKRMDAQAVKFPEWLQGAWWAGGRSVVQRPSRRTSRERPAAWGSAQEQRNGASDVTTRELHSEPPATPVPSPTLSPETSRDTSAATELSAATNTATTSSTKRSSGSISPSSLPLSPPPLSLSQPSSLSNANSITFATKLSSHWKKKNSGGVRGNALPNATPELTSGRLKNNLDRNISLGPNMEISDQLLDNMVNLLSDTISELSMIPIRLASQVLQSGNNERRGNSSNRMSQTAPKDVFVRKGNVYKEESTDSSFTNESNITKSSLSWKTSEQERTGIDSKTRSKTNEISLGGKSRVDVKKSTDFIPNEIASLKNKSLPLAMHKFHQSSKIINTDDNKRKDSTEHDSHNGTDVIEDIINEFLVNIPQKNNTQNPNISTPGNSLKTKSLKTDTPTSERQPKVMDHILVMNNKSFDKIDTSRLQREIQFNENVVENYVHTSSFADANTRKEINLNNNPTKEEGKECTNEPYAFLKDSSTLNNIAQSLEKGETSCGIMTEKDASDRSIEITTNTSINTVQKPLNFDAEIVENNNSHFSENKSNPLHKDKDCDHESVKVEETDSSLTQSITKEKPEDNEEREAKRKEIHINTVTSEEPQHQKETEDKTSHGLESETYREDEEEISNTKPKPDHSLSDTGCASLTTLSNIVSGVTSISSTTASSISTFEASVSRVLRHEAIDLRKQQNKRSSSVGFRAPRRRSRMRSYDPHVVNSLPKIPSNPTASTPTFPNPSPSLAVLTRLERSQAVGYRSSNSSSAVTVMAAPTADLCSGNDTFSSSFYSVETESYLENAELQNPEQAQSSLPAVASEELNAQGDNVISESKPSTLHDLPVIESFLAEPENVKQKTSKTRPKANVFRKLASPKKTTIVKYFSSHNKLTAIKSPTHSRNTFGRMISLRSKQQKHQTGKAIRSVEVEFSDNTKLQIFPTDVSKSLFQKSCSLREEKHRFTDIRKVRLVHSEKFPIKQIRKVGTPQDDVTNDGPSFALAMTPCKCGSEFSCSSTTQCRSTKLDTDISEISSPQGLVTVSFRECGTKTKSWQDEGKSLEDNNSSRNLSAVYETESISSTVRQDTGKSRSIFDIKLESLDCKSLTSLQSSDSREKYIMLDSRTSSDFAITSEIKFTNKQTVSSQTSSEFLLYGIKSCESKSDKGIQAAVTQDLDTQCPSARNQNGSDKKDSEHNTAELLMTSLSNNSFPKTCTDQCYKIKTNTELHENTNNESTHSITQKETELEETKTTSKINSLVNISATSNNYSIIPATHVKEVETLNSFCNLHTIQNCLLRRNVQIETSDSCNKELQSMVNITKALVRKTFSSDSNNIYDFKKVKFPVKRVHSGPILQLKKTKSIKSPLNITLKPVLINQVFFGDNNNKYFWERCGKPLEWHQAFDMYKTFQKRSKESDQMNEFDKINECIERRAHRKLLESCISCNFNTNNTNNNNKDPIIRSLERQVSLKCNSPSIGTKHSKKPHQTPNVGKQTIKSPHLTLSLHLILENKHDKKDATPTPKIEIFNNSGQRNGKIRCVATYKNSELLRKYPVSFTGHYKNKISEVVKNSCRNARASLNKGKYSITTLKRSNKNTPRTANNANKREKHRKSKQKTYVNYVEPPTSNIPLRSILKNPLQPSMNSTNSQDPKPLSNFLSDKQENTMDSLEAERTDTLKSENHKSHVKRSPSLHVHFEEPEKNKVILPTPVYASPVRTFLKKIFKDIYSSDTEPRSEKKGEEIINREKYSPDNSQSEDESDFQSIASVLINPREVTGTSSGNKTDNKSSVLYISEQQAKEHTEKALISINSSIDSKDETCCDVHIQSHTYPIKAIKGVPNMKTSNISLKIESINTNGDSQMCKKSSENEEKHHENRDIEASTIENGIGNINSKQKQNEILKIKQITDALTQEIASETNQNLEDDHECCEIKFPKEICSATPHSDELKMEEYVLESKILNASENVKEESVGGGDGGRGAAGGARKRPWWQCRATNHLSTLAAVLDRLANVYRTADPRPAVEPEESECATEDEVTWDSSGSGVQIKAPPPCGRPCAARRLDAIASALQALQKGTAPDLGELHPADDAVAQPPPAEPTCDPGPASPPSPAAPPPPPHRSRIPVLIRRTRPEVQHNIDLSYNGLFGLSE